MLNTEMDDLQSIENDQQEQSPADNSNWKGFFLELLQTIVMAVILYFAVDFVIARVRVDNISMLPTLQPGEFLIVNKLAYRVGDTQRGDIIIFHYPKDPTEDYIKRVIGIPGDLVEIRDNHVFVNGHQLEEPYIKAPPTYNGEWTIPQNVVFVLGDNRNESSDSHNWGYVPFENIIGKALFIYWPIDEMKSLKHPVLL